MLYRYEIWCQNIWQETIGEPPAYTTSTLDMAMEYAKDYSKEGDIYFVLDKSQNPSKVRGFGRDGKWINATENCKRCDNSGRDYSGNFDLDEDDTCKTCQGSSWKPF